MPLLDRLFGGQAATAIDDPRLYGEFALEPGHQADAISRDVYGINVRPDDETLTVAELFRRELAGDIEPGDRVAYGPVDLIVRTVNEDHEIEEVGLALEPTRQTRPRIPVFQNRKEIAAFIRGLTRRGSSRIRERCRPRSRRRTKKSSRRKSFRRKTRDRPGGAVHRQALVEIAAADVDQLVDVVLEEMVGAVDDLLVDLDALLGLQLVDQRLDVLLRHDLVLVAMDDQARRTGRGRGR